jgi:hypothetical protein
MDDEKFFGWFLVVFAIGSFISLGLTVALIYLVIEVAQWVAGL